MRKRTSFVLISVMMLALVGCGSASAGKLKSSDLSFDYNGNSISVKNDANKTIAALGEPSEEQTSPYNENDKLYIFGSEPDSIELSTVNDYAQSLIIHDSNIRTSRDIGVGNVYNDVIAAYGDNGTHTMNDDSWNISYKYKDYMLSFDMEGEDHKVTAITYSNKPITIN